MLKCQSEKNLKIEWKRIALQRQRIELNFLLFRSSFSKCLTKLDCRSFCFVCHTHTQQTKTQKKRKKNPHPETDRMYSSKHKPKMNEKEKRQWSGRLNSQSRNECACKFFNDFDSTEWTKGEKEIEINANFYICDNNLYKNICLGILVSA